MSSPTGADAAEAVLSHYGIKGMKWGVRRTAAQLARAAGNRTAKVLDDPRSEDQKAVDAIMAKIGKKGDLSRLSNAEIQQLSTRLNMEQNYARLVPTQAGKLERGKAFAVTLAKDIASEQIRRVAKEAVKDRIDKEALKRGLDLNKKETQKAREKAEKKAEQAAKEAAERARRAAADAKKAAEAPFDEPKPNNSKSNKKRDAPIELFLDEDGVYRMR